MSMSRAACTGAREAITDNVGIMPEAVVLFAIRPVHL